ncbi:hypothetical protein GGR57DRAFT_514140 [Xylariaceae sp. FL1272]|nr:hypothetical protein GGR57DRAFT_514140 [Xylariaceae sp. FL1272]
MACPKALRRPLVIYPESEHTHTVIFLHRFAPTDSEYEIRSKALSSKMSKDHITLRDKFPSVRWVFPYALQHPSAEQADSHSNKGHSAEDMAKLNLNSDSNPLPYVTQMILQEAERVHGLDRIILGGQGETAIAAHEAMMSFTQPRPGMLPEELKLFIQQTFHNIAWTETQEIKLGGFIGMHAENGLPTQDVKEHGFTIKFANPTRINEMIVKNTPHCFIRGGYKLQTVTWDGRRIDEVECFLREIGVSPVVTAEGPGAIKPEPVDRLTPKYRPDPKQKKLEKDTRSSVEKHLEEVKKQKAADEEARRRTLIRIECDKLDRMARSARESKARKQASTNPDTKVEEGDAAVKRRRNVRQHRDKWLNGSADTREDNDDEPAGADNLACFEGLDDDRDYDVDDLSGPVRRNQERARRLED